MVKPSQMDPRHLLPSRADPDHRKARKELEKESPIGFTEPLVLGLIGIGLMWNMEHQVEKYQKRKEKKENGGKEQDDRRRARSSRRPPPSSSSRSRRGDDRDYDDRYDRDDGYHEDDRARQQGDLDRYYRPARGYDRDHYYYDYREDEYSRGPRKTDRYNPEGYDVEAAQVPRAESSSTSRRQYWVDSVNGEPRYERRGRGTSVSVSREDGRSEYAAAAPTANDDSSRYGGSAKLGSQYDDGFEKKRFDGLPTEASGPTNGDDTRTRTSERRSRRSRRDSF